MKKILFLLTVFFLFGTFLVQATPATAPAEIIVFVREGCTHCRDAEEFLEKLTSEQTDLLLRIYRLENAADKKIWEQFTARLGIAKVTPITVIGAKYLIGFDSESTTGRDIGLLLEEAKKNQLQTILTNPNLISSGQGSTCGDDPSEPCVIDAPDSYTVSLPLVGRIDTQKYPLLYISALLGFFDGFNPCAMWVLVTFLIILLQIGNRKKMFVFAGTFIVAEAVMYALILTIWYKTWDFVELDRVITPLVGTLSIVGGIFFLREWRQKELECKVTNLQKRASTHQRIKDLATRPFTLMTFFGILGVAFSVNIIEFACSLGIPQAFTKIIELNNLSFLHSSFFIAVYILFYMLDDFFVFGLALYGLDKLHLTTRYSKLSNLLGGIVMIVLGLILLFKSQLLLF